MSLLNKFVGLCAFVWTIALAHLAFGQMAMTGYGSACPALTTTQVIVIQSGSAETVPCNWNSANNAIVDIGAGGGGTAGQGASVSSGIGGGGGAYAYATDVSLSPGASIAIQIGVGGVGGTTSGGAGANGTDTIWNTSLNTVVAKAGGGAGAGGLASASTPTLGAQNGGNGGAISLSFLGGPGGGGGAGPNGPGAVGAAPASGGSGSGGGAADGGLAGVAGASGVGGAGGAAFNGTPGGAGGTTAPTAGGNGSQGSGGGGSGTNSGAGVGAVGGNGGSEALWTATWLGSSVTAGPGGGAGGGGRGTTTGTNGNGGNGGACGGGGGGGSGGNTSGFGNGGNGGNGCIILVWGPGASYVGPGDIVSGATAWYGLRSYSAAYASPGTNLAVNLRRASDNATCDFVVATSGALGGTASGCAQGRGLSLANFATTDATATCTIATTTGTCTGASSTPHVGSTISTTGATAVTQPCYVTAVGMFTAGAGTVTVAGNGAASPCGTISVGETLTFTYGLYATEVYDQTLNGYNELQSTAADQPEVLFSCINSLPCLYGNGSTFYLQASSFPILSQPISTVTVGERTGNFTVSSTYWRSLGSSSLLLRGGSTNSTDFFAGSTVTLTASDQVSHIYTVLWSSSSSVSNIDGTETTINPGTSGTYINSFTLLAEAVPSQYLLGYEFETGLWPSGFTSGNRTSECHNAYSYYGTATSC